MGDEVVIIGDDGTEHIFPPGFDPKRAAGIVRGGPQLKAGPGPMIGALHEDTRQPTGTLMDLIPPRAQRRTDTQELVNALPLAVPGVVGDVRRIPGIIAQAAKLPATKQAAKAAGKYAVEKGAQAAGAGGMYYAIKKIFGD